MEDDILAIEDLSMTLVMASAGIGEVGHDTVQSMLNRLGWLLRERAERLEKRREEAFGLLHGIAGTHKQVSA